MQINTKFDPKQEVVILHENKVRLGTIEHVDFQHFTGEGVRGVKCAPGTHIAYGILVVIQESVESGRVDREELVRRVEAEVWSDKTEMLQALGA